MNARTPKIVLAALAVLLLCSCAEKAAPPPPPAPVVQPPLALPAQDWRHPVFYYATSRAPAQGGATGANYGPQRAREVSYGELRMGTIGVPGDGTDAYRVDVTLERATRLSHAGFLSALEHAAARTPGREVVLFIHGFDNSFADAADTTARIAAGIGFGGAMVLYSWPSAGSPTAYMADRNNAQWSVRHLKELLADIAADPWIGRMAVVVHSMGNEAFTRAYAELARDCARTRGGCGDLRKLSRIALAAPDVDRELFLDQHAAALTSLGAKVVLYSSRSDVALAASAMVQGGDYERLGKNVVCIPGLHVTDVSGVKTDILGHSWLSQSRAVLRDLRCALAEGCDRYAAGLLRRMSCAPSQRAAGVGLAADGPAADGQEYWELMVPQAPAKAPASAGFNFSLPPFLTK